MRQLLRHRARAATAALLLTATLLAACTAEPAESTVSASTTAGVSPPPGSSATVPSAMPPSATAPESTSGPSGLATESTPIAGTSAPPLAQCASESRATVSQGSLTIAAPDDAAGPWFVDPDPATGNGFEAALGLALAGRLGFPADRVRWVAVDRRALANGTASGYDLAAAELTAPDLPDGSVDYSTGYLSAGDALAVADQALSAAAADPDTLGALRIGVVADSSAADELQGFSAAAAPQDFGTADELLAALAAGDLDVAAIDLIDALDARAVIAGTFPVVQGQPRQLSFALPHGSPWTGCVSSVLDSMRADGTLDDLSARWIGPLPELRR